MSGYILNREGLKEETKKKFYRQRELELMTTHQLREICRREKIVQGILNPLDKEELIRVIMRYRGTREQLLIREENEEGRERIEQLLVQGRIYAGQDKSMHIPSKLVVYRGLSMDENDRISIPYKDGLADTNAILVSGGREICGFFNLQVRGNDRAHLYVMKGEGVPCREADLKDYTLYCFGQQDSDRIFSLYYGLEENVANDLIAVGIPLMDVEVREPIPLRMPLVIDFGSTNTTAGVYLDTQYFEQAQGAPFTEGLARNEI